VYLASLLVTGVAQAARVKVTGRIAAWVMNDLRVRVFTQLQRLSLDFYTGEKAGVIMTRMTSDIENLQQLLQDGLVQFAIQGLTMVVVTVVLFTFDVRLALITVVLVVPILTVLSLWFHRASSKGYVRVRDNIANVLADLSEMYANRGVNLVKVAGGYAFRTAPDLSEKLKIERPVTRKLSRAAIETLAIIAYHQPVTRAEIEQVRGVGLSKGTLDLLFEQNWIKPMGRRRAPGKPVTWGTTDFFLEHFGLPSLDDLPGHEEMKAAGLLDPRAQPPIFRPEEPDLPLEPTEDEADEPLAVEEQKS